MAIQSPASNNIPFLINYTPYVAGTNQQICNLIEDMVSVDLQARETPIVINYHVGAMSTLSFSMKVKNLTNNAILEVKIPYDKNFLIIDNPEITLNPAEEKQINISINKNFFDTRASEIFNFDTNIVITNTSSKKVIVKNVNSAYLTSRYLPQEITIT